MRRLIMSFTLVSLLLLTPALAHQTKVVGEGDEQYNVIVGMVREPVFTGERNGLDLIIRRSDDNEPIEGLVGSLNAEITAPDGESTHTFDIRAQWGRPGYYTDDILLSEPGIYTIRVYGFIGEVEFDETFETHEVRPLSDLAFP